MSLPFTAPAVLRLWPTATRNQSLARALVLAFAGTLVLWASAKVQVPFWPVPATLQTVAVVLIGAFYGSRLGAATLALYLAQGAANIPVFAGTPERGLGLAYMVGPTGGYLVGFLVAAFVIGRLVETGFARSLATVAVSVFAAHAAVHVFGLAWLSASLGIGKAVSAGFLPFLPADLVKMALSTAVILAVARPQRAR